MKPYSDFSGQRSRQIVADVIGVAAVAAWIWLGAFIHSSLVGFATYGADMQSAGADFEDSMTEIGTQLGGIPLVGGGIGDLFGAASDAGANLESAGRSQQQAVESIATGLGFAASGALIAVTLLVWLVPRLLFARRAGRSRLLARNPGAVDLLALRALTNQKMSVLTTADPDPASAWRRGDPHALGRLAALELRANGVRMDHTVRGAVRR